MAADAAHGADDDRESYRDGRWSLQREGAIALAEIEDLLGDQ